MDTSSAAMPRAVHILRSDQNTDSLQVCLISMYFVQPSNHRDNRDTEKSNIVQNTKVLCKVDLREANLPDCIMGVDTRGLVSAKNI